MKILLGNTTVPRGLYDLNHYFRQYGSISFRREMQEDESTIVVSENFRFGTIITHVQRGEEFDDKITDAILTAFEVPSSYAKEANVKRVEKEAYAFA